ncbi:cbb3-type cytochrome oxidase assembly protein CcoS [Granulosicoccus sp. 3-233]|uniref:cbb3-type cytochrome oxidase assembly protein CcoS n=1 Tax=Granulosicoccus sp. 3-233 TaxID=3417969 RepID=UPI003D33A90E
MESLFLLIPLSILAVGVAVAVFFWMNHDGQFDDDQGPAWSILLDDDRPDAETSTEDTVANAKDADSATASDDRDTLAQAEESPNTGNGSAL